MISAARPSQLRRTILDSELSGDKYTGVQTSRELLAEDIDSNHSSPDVEGDGVTASPQHFNVSHTAADYGDQEEDHQHRGSLPRLESRQSHDLPGVQDLTFALHESRTADREKGKTIVKQTVCWLYDRSNKTLLDAHSIIVALGLNHRCPHQNAKSSRQCKSPPKCTSRPSSSHAPANLTPSHPNSMTSHSPA